VRLAILISFAAFGLIFIPAQAGEPFVRVDLGSRAAYIIPESYADEHKAELVASIPGPVKVEGFWTPSEEDVTVAERVFRELIQSAAKDPTLLFADLADASQNASQDALQHQQIELELMSKYYAAYLRQYVGIIVDGRKLVLCNYADVPKVDPSMEYLYVEKYFVGDGTTHFLQSRFDLESKTCSNVAIIGSWQPKEN